MTRRQAPPATPPSRRVWPWGLALAAATVLTYANGLGGPFIFDDQLSVVENTSIRQWWKLGAVLSPERELPTAGRPLVNLSFALNYWWAGYGVVGYHVVNLAFHVAVGVLLFAVVRRTLELPSVGGALARRATPVSFAVALLWALHPLNTEAVNYVTERTELMMGFFYLATLYASIRAAGSAAARWTAIAVLASAAGMACKESMVTAPPMVLVYDCIFLSGSLQRALAARATLYGGLCLSWLVLAASIWSGPRVHSAGLSSGVSPWTYLLNQAVMITEYLRRTAWPRSLVINYGFPLPLGLADVWPYGVLVIALALLTVAALVRRPAFGFLGAWFFVTLAPTSSLVPIATEVGAERRMYLPLMALVALVVIGVSRVRWTQTSAGPIVVGVVALLLSAGTIARNREYISELALARTVVERHPTSVAHNVLGNDLIREGDEAVGEAELRLALPGDPRAHYTLGSQFLKHGNYQGAVDEFQAFVAAAPLALEAVSARQMLGQAFVKQGRWAEAIEQEQMVLTMNPSGDERVNAEALIGDAYFGSRAFAEAAPHYRQFIFAKPDDFAAYMHLGVALVATDKLAEATEAFRRAVALDRGSADAERNLANALYDQEQYGEALAHAERAVALRPSDADANDLAGRCLALAGKFDEARGRFERALQINPAHADARDDLRKLAQIARIPTR